MIISFVAGYLTGTCITLAILYAMHNEEWVNMNGWIKLHRKLLENPIFYNAELLQLFIYLLLRVNHEPKKMIFNCDEITINPGQVVTGRLSIAEDLKQNPNTVYKRLYNLKKLKILNIESNNKFSLVTIENWDLYQIEELESNNKSNNKVTTKEQQSNTNKNVKNDKNDKKKDIKDIPPEKEKFNDHVYLTVEQHKKLITDYGDQATSEYIERLNDYIGQIGAKEAEKKYKCHYSVIRNWKRRDGEKVVNFNNTKKVSKGTALDQYMNFDQRTYDKDYFDKLYDNQ